MKIDVGPTVYLPGDEVKFPKAVLQASDEEPIVLGPGLKRLGDSLVVATRPGVLRRAEPKSFWLDTRGRRYVPTQEDRVIGIVTQRLGEGWKVDIGSADIGQLGTLSMEGATKRNRAMFREGTLLFCRVAQGLKDMEPEVSCMGTDEKACGLGVIGDGASDSCLFHISLSLARKLLSPHFSLVRVLGKALKFEITIGINGRMWIKAASVKEVIGIANCLMEGEFSTEADVYNLVEKHSSWIKGF